MIKPEDIVRLELGHYTMPPDSRWAGQQIVVSAFLVRHPAGLMLFDTGIGTGHARAEREFGPIRRNPLQPALAGAGVQISDVTTVANCHLHLDHCGSNPLFRGVPIFVQKQEVEALPVLDYALPGVIDFDGARIETPDGPADVAGGLTLIPTPGHTPGHQALLVHTTRGKVLLAGQAFDSASEYQRALYTCETPDGDYAPPPWLQELRELDVRLALFAHDLLPWAPRPA
jgi:N-acyl homoserine lactone hydrolase